MSTPANFEKNETPTIKADQAALLLIDHQSGLFQVVEDLDLPTLRRNVVVLSKVATLANIPVITTASVPQGPNGRLMPEIHENAPHAKYIARKGEVNSWDCQPFVDAVKATGKKQLIIAGTLTSVCMAFPAISAIAEGFQVFVVVDASGTYSKTAQDTTLARVVQAGAVPMDTPAVVSEIQHTWHREDAEEWMNIWAEMLPKYQLLIESHTRAQETERNNEPLDSE